MVFPRGCLNSGAIQTAHAVINAFTDVLVVSLPIVLLQRKQIDSNRKKFIVGIFILAGVAILASFARIMAFAILSTTFGNPELVTLVSSDSDIRRADYDAVIGFSSLFSPSWKLICL